MTTTGALGPVTTVQYATSVMKLERDQQKADGKAAVELIEGAKAAPGPGPEGQGTHVNTYG